VNFQNLENLSLKNVEFSRLAKINKKTNFDSKKFQTRKIYELQQTLCPKGDKNVRL
jgi:hypothetical protein